MRDAKRASMDGRHDFMLSTVAERLGMTQEDVEEFMLDGDQVGTARVFILAAIPSLTESNILIHCFIFCGHESRMLNLVAMKAECGGVHVEWPCGVAMKAEC